PTGGPELVFALACPAGTPDDAVLQALEGGLLSYGYEPWLIKLSDHLSDSRTVDSQQLIDEPEHERVTALMDAGNELCARHNTGAAVAFLGISEIHGLRRRYHGNIEDSDTIPIPRAAYVLDSLKRPAEVTQLRRIYGDHLILIGLQASNKTRIQYL